MGLENRKMARFHLKEHIKLNILAISDFKFLCPTGNSGLKLEPMLQVYLAQSEQWYPYQKVHQV